MTTLEQLWSRFEGYTRTDVVLVALPIVFLGIFLALDGMWASTDSALSLASIACVALIVDRLFVHPPTESERV